MNRKSSLLVELPHVRERSAEPARPRALALGTIVYPCDVCGGRHALSSMLAVYMDERSIQVVRALDAPPDALIACGQAHAFSLIQRALADGALK